MKVETKTDRTGCYIKARRRAGLKASTDAYTRSRVNARQVSYIRDCARAVNYIDFTP